MDLEQLHDHQDTVGAVVYAGSFATGVSRCVRGTRIVRNKLLEYILVVDFYSKMKADWAKYVRFDMSLFEFLSFVGIRIWSWVLGI